MIISNEASRAADFLRPMDSRFDRTYVESHIQRAIDAHEMDLVEALKALFLEQVDYITINHLGDPLHNQSMKMAKAALERRGK